MPLAVTSMGMVSSVGRDVVAACSAVRAGISRPREIDDFSVLDEEDQSMTPLIGHPVRGYTEGFVGVGRWLRLAEGALANLFEDPSLPGGDDSRFWERTGLTVIVPRFDEDRYAEAQGDGGSSMGGGFLRQLTNLADRLVSTSERRVLPGGGAGLAHAVALAERAIAQGAVERFLFVAVDSLVDAQSLEWLDSHGRLKTQATPVGVSPGEAGVAVLVEAPARSQQRRAAFGAVIESAAFDQEPDHLFSGRPSGGGALARAVRAAVGQTRLEGGLFLDLNGEEWRAVEWGGANARLHDVLHADVRVSLPAAALGDVGAAAGLASLAYATQAFLRGHASGPRALVVSSSEYGDVGAVILRGER